jgi:tetratricopeptide (TPR) repeat protein
MKRKGLPDATAYFKQAIALDPEFALAHAGLADSYQLQVRHFVSKLPAEQMYSKAEESINTALMLDKQLSEAYASLGYLRMNTDDFKDAETALKKAITLNPNYAEAYHWYAGVMAVSNRFEEAIIAFQRARLLDPQSAVINASMGLAQVEMGLFDDALQQFTKAIEIDSTYFLGYFGKAHLYWSAFGRLDEAIRYFQKVLSLIPGTDESYVPIGLIYLDLGDDTLASCWGQRAIELAPDNRFANLLMALLHSYKGENDQARDYAQKSLADKSPSSAPPYYPITFLPHQNLPREDFTKVRAIYEQRYPSLMVTTGPRIDKNNFRPAIDLAYVLQRTGEQERADLLLNGADKLIRATTRLGTFGFWVDDVRIYSIRGETQKALIALRQAIDDGWRVFWRYFLEYDPVMVPLHNEPEYQAMVKEIETDMANQLARVKEMERASDICVEP